MKVIFDQLDLFVDYVDIPNYLGAKEKSPYASTHHERPSREELRDMYLCGISASMPFQEAAKLFLQMLEIEASPNTNPTIRYIRDTTFRSYQEYIESLSLFFRDKRLDEIHIWDIKAYQLARSRGDAPFLRYRRPHDKKARIVDGQLTAAKGKSLCLASAKKVNQETDQLRRIMRQANAWTDQLQKHYRKLRAADDNTRRALTLDEERRWLQVSASKDRWKVIHWYSIVAFDTTCSTNEMRAFRIGDIDLYHREINISWAAAKCASRQRVLQVTNADCLWALQQLLDRAAELGSKNPQDYLFPIRIKGKHCKGDPKYDPTHPMTVSGLKRLWQEVRDATGLTWFRLYDTRHTGGTRMAENGVAPAVIKARMGHKTDKMHEHYARISSEAQQRWLANPREEFMRQQRGWAPPVEQAPSIQRMRAPGKIEIVRGRERFVAG